MLNSRYLHLHEALGLGPMWFQRGAKVLPTAKASPAAVPTPSAAPSTLVAAVAKAAAAPSAAVQQARLTTIAMVGGQSTARSDSLNQAQEPAEKTTAPPTLETAQATASETTDWLHTLAGRIPHARVLVAAICPAPEDSVSGQLFSGRVGVLLDNMLASAGLRATDTHKTSWVQDAPIFSPNPVAADILATLPRMQAELALSQAEAVLLLGQVFEKSEHADAITALCGKLPCFIIPHPARLLRQPQLKAQAWQELKKLRRFLAE